MKNINNYTAEDLAQDHDFIAWAKGSKDKAFERDWSDWIAQNPEKQSLVDEAKVLVNSFKFKSQEVSQDREDLVWNSISKTIDQGNSKEVSGVKRRTLLKTLAYASMSIAAAFGLYMFFSMPGSETVQISTELVKVQSHTLPDGSLVTLNADSKLDYNLDNWNTNRTLELRGEAYFEVKKGSTFTVNTPDGIVTVLGTSFNIYNRKKELKVYCNTGKVSVSSQDKKTILMPGNAVIVNAVGHSDITQVSSKSARSTWKQGIYNYESAPLNDVVEELQRQLDVTIKIDPKLKRKFFTGSFTNSDLDSALSEVFWPLGLKYDIKGNTVVVTQ